MINNRIIGLSESERNRDVLHVNPTYSSSNVPYKRYQNNSIFKMDDASFSINKRIGMSQDTRLIAEPCETVSDRMADRQQGGFRRNHYEVKAHNGLNKLSFTTDRLGFTADLNQKPLINNIY